MDTNGQKMKNQRMKKLTKFIPVILILLVLIGIEFWVNYYRPKNLMVKEKAIETMASGPKEPDSLRIQTLINYSIPDAQEIGMKFNSNLKFKIVVFGGSEGKRYNSFRNEIQNKWTNLIKICMKLDKSAEINIAGFRKDSIVYSYFKKNVFDNITYYFEFDINESNIGTISEYEILFNRIYCKNNFNLLVKNSNSVMNKFFKVYECTLNGK